MIKFLVRALALAAVSLSSVCSIAQTATGTSTTSCTQSGSVMTCTTSTSVALPSGVNLTSGSGLTQFGLSGGPVGPACSPLTANPTTVPSGGATSVALTVTCPVGTTYTYTWASPVVPAVGTNTATHFPNLSVGVPSQVYGVTVCLASNASACSTYTTTVTLTGGTPALSGCSVSPSSTSVVQGGTTTLNASCQQGTGSGSGANYVWSRNGTQVANGASASYALTASDTASIGSYTYTVAITNNAPSSASPSAAVTVTAPSNFTDFCPSTPIRATIEASSPYSRVISSDYVGTFTAGDNFVIQLNVAANDTTAGAVPAVMNFSDIGTNRGGRYVTVSKSKCDYRVPSVDTNWVSGYFLGAPIPQNAASKSFGLNDANSPGAIKLTTGTWYINIQNVVGQCPSNVSCHVVVDWDN